MSTSNDDRLLFAWIRPLRWPFITWSDASDRSGGRL